MSIIISLKIKVVIEIMCRCWYFVANRPILPFVNSILIIKKNVQVCSNIDFYCLFLRSKCLKHLIIF